MGSAARKRQKAETCDELAAKDQLAVEYLPIERVIPYARNPRKNDGAVAKVAASIREFGFRQPIVVDAHRTVIAGHTRLKAARELGMATVPVHVANGLTAAQVKAYRLADNRSGEEAEWDGGLVGLELADLKGLDFDLLVTGFDADELSALMPPADGEEADDVDLEPPASPKSQEGEMWALGRHRLMCGSSTDIDTVRRFLGPDKPTFAYMDPPYGISIVKGAGTVGSGGKFRGTVGTGKIVAANQYEAVIGDDSIETARGAIAVCRELGVKVQVFWGANHYSELLPSSSAWLFWDKRDGGAENDFADGELAFTNTKGAVRIFRHLWNGMMKASEKGQRRCHPTQKPVALAEFCFSEYGKADDIVFDGFGGSGASLIAAERTGRTMIMSELSAPYCDVIRRRYAEFVNDPTLAP